MSCRFVAVNTIGKLACILLLLCSTELTIAQEVKLKKKDRKRDISLVTTQGTIVLRLYDSTPNHRDNFLRLVKSHFYDSILFHRVIQNFMIQAGDPNTKAPFVDTSAPDKDLGYTLLPEFRSSLFHRKGVVAAARTGDDVNPTKSSSASQFYIVKGKVFNDASLDSVETFRLRRKIPLHHREVYKTIGGTPQLDQNYTIFGEVVRGMDIVDKISAVATNKPGDKPVVDVRIIEARLVKRKRN